MPARTGNFHLPLRDRRASATSSGASTGTKALARASYFMNRAAQVRVSTSHGRVTGASFQSSFGGIVCSSNGRTSRSPRW
jgi:hypothetical protein